jgi:hypothetical protein
MGEDRLAPPRPQRLGAIVAHVGHKHQRRIRDQLGRALAAAGRDQRVLEPRDHERRNAQRAQSVGADPLATIAAS